MSFLKRLKDRRSRGGAVSGPQVPVSPPQEEDVEEMRVGPLADFVMGSGKDCVVDLGLAQGGWSQAKQKSRLSKTTREVLHDHSALAYLIQYLEARDAVQLVKFWLDVESFRSSASTVITSSYIPPQVSRERLDMVPESGEAGQDYDEADESLCEEARLPDSSASTESFDSGLDSRSDFTGELTSPSSAPAGLTSPGVGSSTISPLAGGCNSSQHSVPGKTIPSHRTCSPPPPPTSAPPSSRGRAEQLLQTRAEDAVKIYRRYIAPECLRPVHLPTEYKRQIVERICAEEGHVAPDCFDAAQEKVVEILDTEYFPDFINSQFHAKHQVDVLTSGEVRLTDILYNDTALFHFMEFLEGKGQRAVMEFWLAATNFSQSAQEGRTDCQGDAMVLYDKFISMQATSPLGFPSSVRLQVEDSICSQGGPDYTCFLVPLQLVAKYLEERYLEPFLQSSLYSNYVKELIGTIQASPRSMSGLQASIYSSSTRSCRTESDTRSSCSSDFSYDRDCGGGPHPVLGVGVRRSTSNTLLASSSSVINSLDRNGLSFDCRELQDPDSIWRRRPVRNKVGRVNSFGRYEPGLDLAPEMSRTEGTKRSSRLGRVVRNLVTNEEKERLKEELAWQVAEMIVRDVTSVTMPEKERRRRNSLETEEEEERRRREEERKVRKSRSESYSLKELSMELPTAKYF